MESRDNKLSSLQQGEHQNPLAREISDDQKNLNESAHSEAEKDMDDDAELTAHSPNDDLDEGETARLGEDIPAII
ncbi:MAG: hypothetical protein JWR72_2399 [Flavisolibacter sp.]|jgi:hypothetical protein|nr:hypothetical protein [Flavisolibacter sp.]